MTSEQDDEMRKAAREYTNDGIGQIHFEAGWQACASRPLTDQEVEAMARAILEEAEPAVRGPDEIHSGHPRWTFYKGEARAAYAALSRLRTGSTGEGET